MFIYIKPYRSQFGSRFTVAIFAHSFTMFAPILLMIPNIENEISNNIIQYDCKIDNHTITIDTEEITEMSSVDTLMPKYFYVPSMNIKIPYEINEIFRMRLIKLFDSNKQIRSVIGRMYTFVVIFMRSKWCSDMKHGHIIISSNTHINYKCIISIIINGLIKFETLHDFNENNTCAIVPENNFVNFGDHLDENGDCNISLHFTYVK
jgi:hypothetical protein